MNKPNITLKQIQTIIKNKEFAKFYRSEETEQNYQVEKEQAIKNLRERLKKERTNPNQRWVIRKNDYPYHLEKNLEHWIVWDLGDYSHITGEVRWEVMKKDYNYDKTRKKSTLHHTKGWLYWINPPQLRSVNDIPHIHLIKEKEITNK